MSCCLISNGKKGSFSDLHVVRFFSGCSFIPESVTRNGQIIFCPYLAVVKPNRRSIRLHGYDYASAGWYFVTICCKNRTHLFGEIRDLVCKGELQFALTAMKIKELDFKIWQRNYYEHIIRNERAFKKISKYIRDNPANWNDDEFFLSKPRRSSKTF